VLHAHVHEAGALRQLSGAGSFDIFVKDVVRTFDFIHNEVLNQIPGSSYLKLSLVYAIAAAIERSSVDGPQFSINIKCADHIRLLNVLQSLKLDIDYPQMIAGKPSQILKGIITKKNICDILDVCHLIPDDASTTGYISPRSVCIFPIY
jgi:hypothetical protein